MQAKKVTFSYKEGKKLFDNLNIELKKGKITTIIGPNGCGKSTLLGILTKAYKPTSGSISLDGIDIINIKNKEFAKNVAVVHQQNNATLDMTIRQLVSYGRTPYESLGYRKTKQEEDIIDWALECTNLKAIQGRSLQNLSGGQRQRAFIALALCQKTDLLFLDEPTTYLDLYYQLELLELIKKLNKEQNLTIVMVLHDLNQAINYSDEVIVMKK